MQNNDCQGFTKAAMAAKTTKQDFKHRIYTDYLRRYAYGVDASCYSYVPQVVVAAHNEEEIQILLDLSRRFKTPLTFRAAGSSLSGQACTDSVLVLANARWKNIAIKNNGQSIVCDCGVIGSDANNALKPFGRKIGPDPATINNAMIGGIFSNNSSGMCCGVKQNSYHTVKAIRVLLHDGSVLDTSDEARENENLEAFKARHGDKVLALQALREEILGDRDLSALIRRKFSIKNTTGYSLNALLDFGDLKDMLNHIFVGAEGTLGFVSRVEYETIEDLPFKACALLFYENLATAGAAVRVLAELEDLVSAAEIMDYDCLRAAKAVGDLEADLADGQCALLVQLEDSKKAALQSKIDHICKALSNTPSLFGETFSDDARTQEAWWRVRKGILPLCASLRSSGSIVITEDVCFDKDRFASGLEALTRLFDKFDFEGRIFGHALSGNAHFIITPLLSDEGQSARFGAFMEAMVDEVLKLGGSTKAEHGTGRMVAPFVEKEWGSKAYAINKKIKSIFDPDSLLNPDVIISDNPKIHLENLKPSALVYDFIDQCMECGFCEKVCPSRELSLTPRQRIAVQREIARLEGLKNKTKEEKENLDSLHRDYDYAGVQTCATCSLCALPCPLNIDTAKLTSKLAKPQSALSSLFAKNLSQGLGLARVGLGLANASSNILGKNKILWLSKKLHEVWDLPLMPKELPRVNTHGFKSKPSGSRKVVYFSSCINRVMAPPKGAFDPRPLQAAFESVCEKAGVGVIYPSDIDGLCCGKAFKSNEKARDSKAYDLLSSLFNAGANDCGVDVICDHSACSYEIFEAARRFGLEDRLRIYDLPKYLAVVLLDRLRLRPIDEDIALYVVCSSRVHGDSEFAMAVARACTKGKVVSHEGTQCCGFAGDKGFSRPELNAAALREFGDFYASLGIRRGYSSASTCEIGLNTHCSFSPRWQHLVYLVDECC